ncbi:hypothetical protein SA23_0462 [Salmonella enterica subsp. enterica serovar Agona str. 23.F.01]|nr:hypothetical protein SA23_0462 [Salmonella enterica subsp. enterica serovar Agona str. 23.F.01]
MMSACFFGRQYTMTTIIFYSKKFALFLKLLTAFIESGPLKGNHGDSINQTLTKIID